MDARRLGRDPAFGTAAPIQSPGLWPGWDVARAMVVTSRDAAGMPDGRQGYLMDGWGGVHPWGGAPAFTGMPYTPNQDRWRGLEIHYGTAAAPDGGWMMDQRGRSPSSARRAADHRIPPAPVFQQLHGTATADYAIGKYGVITTYGSGASADWTGYSDWGAWDIIRDIVLANPANSAAGAQPVSSAGRAAYAQWLNPRGGVVLDGYGGLHPFGGMPIDARGAAYWRNNYDIARALSLHPDGTGGWTLDGWGGGGSRSMTIPSAGAADVQVQIDIPITPSSCEAFVAPAG